MNYLTVLFVSVALGIDAFSVAVSIGLTGARKKQMLIMAATVMIFHIVMPLFGLSLGTYLGKLAGPMAGSIGALVLIAIGLSIVWNNARQPGASCLAETARAKDAVRGRGITDISSPASLVLMAASVSLDALSVGFGLGALRVDLFITVITMGVVAGSMTVIGLAFGRRLNRTFGEKAEIAGGVILIIIGLKLLFS